MAWTVTYYISPGGDNPVSEFLDTCSKKQQVKILRIFQYLQEYGFLAAIPHIKKLSGTPFWEIRILGKDNIRIIYVYDCGKMIVVLHGFVKKGQKTPTGEMKICDQRYRELKNRKS